MTTSDRIPPVLNYNIAFKPHPIPVNEIDLLITPRWLVPVDSNKSVLEGYGVAVHKDIILQIGPASNLKATYAPKQTVDLPDHALIPGLVNAHTHAAMTLFRGYADDLPLMEWLNQHIWPAESRWVDEKFVRNGTDLACAEMIKSGTTCFNDMYFFPDVVAKRAEKAGMRACIGMIVVDFPTVWAQTADEYINKGLDVRDSIRHSNLVTAAFAPHAPYTVSDQYLQKIATLSDELDCQVHIHLHETAHEIEESMARFGMRPIERLDQIGLVGPRLVAVHMTQLLPGEIESLAERGIHIVYCPRSNLKLASGFCEVWKINQSGINIALGTDSASSNNNLDMMSEMMTASLLAKGVSGSPTAMNAYSALEAATMGGARALGLEEKIGSIEVGKQADLCAVDLSDIGSQPVYNPVSQIVYSASSRQVSDVWVAGQRLLKAGELTTLDEQQIKADTLELGNRIKAGQR